jgi:hypothetical protein
VTPVEAMQEALAGEHAAVYVYGVLGGRVSDSRSPVLAQQLASAYAAHRGRRDQLTTLVRRAGGDPVAADLSYRVPNPATTEAQLRAAARTVEQRCAAVYADMVGSTSRADRAYAVAALSDTAVRGLTFGARPTPYPGVPEL